MAFLSPLDVRVLDDCGIRPRMLLLNDLHYQSKLVGTVIVPRGTIFDGASIPQVFMSVTGWPGLRAACVHDYLIDTKMARETADKVFREALGEDGCGVAQDVAELMYSGVRLFSKWLENGTRTDDDDHIGA